MNVLFYTSIPRLFRSTLIGFLYEIAQRYPTILLSETLDPRTTDILRNKTLFPQLKKIIPISQFTGNKLGRLKHYRYLHQRAKNLVAKEKPRIVFATGTYPFETYLRRYAKKQGAITISAIGPIYGQTNERWRYHLLNNACTRMPQFLPLTIRVYLVLARKYLAHVFYYWVLPFLVGEKAFIGEPSFPLLARYERFRKGADYYLVFLRKDRKALINKGVPPQKLILIAHPLEGRSRALFETVYFSQAKTSYTKSRKIVTILWPEERVGFWKGTYTPIPKEEMEAMNEKVVAATSRILADWDVIIKPHPGIKDVSNMVKQYQSFTPRIIIVNPQEPADRYIETSDLIIGLPPVSTALYTASLQTPQKPIISIDFQKELLGDCFKKSVGIEYVTNEKAFNHLLTSIWQDKYQKLATSKKQSKKLIGINEIIERLCSPSSQH